MKTQAPPPPGIKERNQLRSSQSLIGDRIEAKGGKVCGKCADFLFDEDHWTVRYIVADTGGAFTSEKVLLSPFVFLNPEFGAFFQTMPTVMSEELIASAPSLDTDAPISRKYERELARHFDYPLYWAGAGLWGLAPYPVAVTPDPEESVRHEEKMAEISESRLRSCKELVGYRVSAGNEIAGEVKDFIVETKPWRIRYLVVQAGNWLRGREILLSPDWIETINWQDELITVKGITRENIEDAPAFDPTKGVNRDLEDKLYDYYGRRRYWL